MGTGWLSDVGPWVSAWPEGLWRASWQGALGVALVWALTRAWPRMPASLRAGLWWLVALKFVVSLGWTRPVPLPLLPASLAPAVAGSASSQEPREAPSPRASQRWGIASPLPPSAGEPAAVDALVPRMAPRGEGAAVLASPPSAAAPSSVHRGEGVPALVSPLSAPAPVPWGRGLALGLLVVWVAGVLWHGRGHVKGWAAMRRLRRGARRLEHPVLEAEVRALSAEAGLRRVPGLLVSESVASPLATGLVSPVVVLPEKAVRRLPVEALRMALAHELAHLRRGDLWLGWVPALAEALLFFHPLARRAAREYALAREEACDAEALRLSGAEPADYGELLLAFGVARGAGTAAAHGASAHIHALHRRLSMLEHVEVGPTRSRRLLKVALSVLGLAALVPFQVVAQESAGKAAPPSTPAGATQAKPAAPATEAPAKSTAASVPPAAPKAATAPTTPSTPAPSRVATVPPPPPAPPPPRVAAVPPVPPPPRVAAVPPVPPVPPVPRGLNDDDDSSYVLLADNMATMNGSSVDLNLAGMFKQPGKELLYVRRKGEAFIIRDPATLKAIRVALEPTRELGKAQGELGGKQGELGRQQGELGQKQGELGLKQGELGLKQAELAHKRAGLHLEERRLEALPEAERERREAELSKQEQALEQELEALEKQMEALGEQQEALGREQEKLGEQQEALGREQEKLGEQQEKRAEEAEKKVQGLIDEALRKGLGQPLPT